MNNSWPKAFIEVSVIVSSQKYSYELNTIAVTDLSSSFSYIFKKPQNDV